MRDPFGSFHFGRLAFGNLARILESLTSTPLAHKKCMFWTVMRSALGESTHTCERFLSYRIVVATLCHIILRKCLPLVASRLEPTQSLISTPPTVPGRARGGLKVSFVLPRRLQWIQALFICGNCQYLKTLLTKDTRAERATPPSACLLPAPCARRRRPARCWHASLARPPSCLPSRGAFCPSAKSNSPRFSRERERLDVSSLPSRLRALPSVPTPRLRLSRARTPASRPRRASTFCGERVCSLSGAP